MEGISDIRIVGLDARRPPVIRKAPYIDLFFELSHAVPKDWSEDFNGLLSKSEFPAKIQIAEGLYIETWVRTPDEVTEQFELLKSKVAECNERYIARTMLSRGDRDAKNSSLEGETGEQGRLNRIVAGLEFGD